VQTQEVCWPLANEEQTVLAGLKLGEALKGRGVVHLVGEMGAGKTTFCRGVLRHYGHEGAVKSPTYSLVEPYSLSECEIYHFDLFRLSDPEEFNYLGFDDYFSSQAICLVEWPEKGADFLPLCDLIITIKSLSQGAEKNSNLNASGSVGVSRQDRPVVDPEPEKLENPESESLEEVVFVADTETSESVAGRILCITANSDYGQSLMDHLAKQTL